MTLFTRRRARRRRGFLVAALVMSLAGLVSPGIALAAPPSNDNFADATAILGLPFTQSVDLAEATAEAGEPSTQCGGPVSQSVWYSFTATETISVTARLSGYAYYSVVAVFTGSSLSGLTQVACQGYWDPMTFRATAGQTYYLQLGNRYSGYDSVQLNLDVAPPIRPEFYTSPYDPSSYDVISFYDYTYDQGGSEIVSREWEFGDGATDNTCCPYHRYAADGDYTIRLTDTTSDGRTGSTSRVLQVRTHDVAVDRFSVPQAASAGQTRGISVYLRNTRYDETVRVWLYKSTTGGFVQVGSLVQFVAARSSGRTVEFPFNYTFTADDAAIGKVTFNAFAGLEAARDALTADNTVISTPTVVH